MPKMKIRSSALPACLAFIAIAAIATGCGESRTPGAAPEGGAGGSASVKHEIPEGELRTINVMDDAIVVLPQQPRGPAGFRVTNHGSGPQTLTFFAGGKRVASTSRPLQPGESETIVLELTEPAYDLMGSGGITHRASFDTVPREK
jgi:hypothetical protein